MYPCKYAQFEYIKKLNAALELYVRRLLNPVLYILIH